MHRHPQGTFRSSSMRAGKPGLRLHRLDRGRDLIVLLVFTLMLACSNADPNTDIVTAAPPDIADHECAVCGMLVRDQPAPRARATHRDGTEEFTCSVGDLLVYLAAPSPNGRASEVLVEVLQPDEDLNARDTHDHAWIAVEAAAYVVGVERRGIMGLPVLAYAQRSDAETVAGEHPAARVVDLAGLETWWQERHR